METVRLLAFFRRYSLILQFPGIFHGIFCWVFHKADGSLRAPCKKYEWREWHRHGFSCLGFYCYLKLSQKWKDNCATGHFHQRKCKPACCSNICVIILLLLFQFKPPSCQWLLRRPEVQAERAPTLLVVIWTYRLCYVKAHTIITSSSW